MTDRLYLFDDARAREWEPFALTRPAAELVLGAMRFWERATLGWGVEYGGHLAAPHLAGFREEGGPRALTADDVGTRGRRILVSSRAVVRGPPRELPSVPAELCVEGARVGWSLPGGAPLPHPRYLAHPAAAPRMKARLELDGFVLEHLWELPARAPDQLRRDLEEGRVTSSSPAAAAGATPGGAAPAGDGPPGHPPRSVLPAGVHLLGDGPVSLGRGTVVEPGVLLDTESGPIVLGEGVRVRGPGRLVGPLYVGPGSTILGGVVSASYVGPACKVRGDIENSTLLGYDNKAHEGFLGHALLGRWVNIGAATNNSNLRNDYRAVRVHTSKGAVSSGLVKLGCFLGDHVRTGIGTLLGTGAVVGAGCNLFGATTPVRYRPPFRWGAARDAPLFRVDRFLDAATRMMSRRGVTLTPEMRALLERAWLSVAGTE